MTELNCYLLDVFTRQPFGGNPLAVFPNADGLSTDLMQKIASELNLSETTFIQSPQTERNDCTVRIFTPKREIPMAGHPTIGTAYVIRKHALVAPQNRTFLLFDEGVGTIQVDFETDQHAPSGLMMHQPLPTFGDILDKGVVAELLSLEIQDLDPNLPVKLVSCGLPFIMVPLRNLDGIQRARLQSTLTETRLTNLDCQEFFLFTQDTQSQSVDVHCRMFAPRFGVPEDPATGSAHGPLGSYLFQHSPWQGGQIISEQGVEMGRASQIRVEIKSEQEQINQVLVGGDCVEIGSGTIRIGNNS